MISTLLSFIPGIGPISAFFTANAWARRLGGAILILVVIAGLIFGTYHKGRHDQRLADAEIAETARQKAAALAEVARARADTQREADNAKTEHAQKELTDAVAHLPDSVPSARRVALGCKRLQLAGTDVSKLPQCRRPNG